MNSPSKERVLLSILDKTNIPGSNTVLLACFLAKYQENFIQEILKHAGEICFSYNDTYLIYHEYHKKSGKSKIIEIACPYAESQFCFVDLSEFIQLIERLLSGDNVERIELLDLDSSHRDDFEDSSHEYW